MARESLHKAMLSDRIADANRERDRTSWLLRQVWGPSQCVVATFGVELTVVPVPGVGLVAPGKFGNLKSPVQLG